MTRQRLAGRAPARRRTVRPERLLGRAAVLAVGVSVALASPVSACVEPRPGPSQALQVVLDASGSMRATDGGGQPRFATAQQVLERFVDEVPDPVQVGLRVYGSRVPVGDRAAGCRDSVELVPVGPVDRGAIRAAVRATEATGYTPIGASLRAAVEELPDASDRRVLLVSDGIDSCGLPPCQVARQVAGRTPGVQVDTVGFDVPDAAADELRCIAAVTGGTYSEASDARTLYRAFRRYLAEGDPVEGGAAPDQPRRVTAGQYLDDLPLGGERWYLVDAQGLSELTASATLVGDEDPGAATRLEIEVRVPDVVGDLRCDEAALDVLGRGVDHVAARYREPVGTPGPCGETGQRLVGVALRDRSAPTFRPRDEVPPPPPSFQLELLVCGATDVGDPGGFGGLAGVRTAALQEVAEVAERGTFPAHPTASGFGAGLLATLLLAGARGRRDG